MAQIIEHDETGRAPMELSRNDGPVLGTGHSISIGQTEASHLVVLDSACPRSMCGQDLFRISFRQGLPGGGTSPGAGGGGAPGAGTPPGTGTPGFRAPPPGTGWGATAPGGNVSGWVLTSVARPPPPNGFWDGSSAPGGTGAVPTGGGGSIPMARIRARCDAAWVLAQGKSGALGKY